MNYGANPGNTQLWLQIHFHTLPHFLPRRVILRRTYLNGNVLLLPLPMILDTPNPLVIVRSTGIDANFPKFIIGSIRQVDPGP